VNHQITPFIVVVVCNHESSRPLWHTLRIDVDDIQRLQNLRCFTPWRGTQVDYPVVRFDVQEEGWDHGDGFLPRNVPCLTFADEEVLEFAKGGVFADDVFFDGDLPGERVGVPGEWDGGLDGFALVGEGGEGGEVVRLKRVADVDGVTAR
jgi:hypothetical protein